MSLFAKQHNIEIDKWSMYIKEPITETMLALFMHALIHFPSPYGRLCRMVQE